MMRIKAFVSRDALVLWTLRGRFRTCRYMLRWVDLWIAGWSLAILVIAFFRG